MDIVQTPNSPSPGTPMSPNFPFNPSGVDDDTQPNPTLLVGANGTNSDGSPRTQAIQTAQGGGLLIQPSPQAEEQATTRNDMIQQALQDIATAIGGNAVGDGATITATSPFSTIGDTTTIIFAVGAQTITLKFVNGLSQGSTVV